MLPSLVVEWEEELFLLELLLRTQASEAEVDLKIQCLEEGYIEEALQFSSEEAFIHSACSDPRSKFLQRYWSKMEAQAKAGSLLPWRGP